MILKTVCVGAFRTNCYILGCKTSKEAIIIDPGDDADLIQDQLRAAELLCKTIVNTHGHMDHTGANKTLAEATGAIIAIGKKDASFLENPADILPKALNYLVRGAQSPPADLLLSEGDMLYAGNIQLQVIDTPGHTPGSISLLGGNMVFSGDTIFASGGIGRTDFPGGCHEQLVESIKDKLLILPDETLVYPGHGPSTTIGRERAVFNR
ncbi:MAG: MBL fold metallo-hydrolase [Firmicutes bacterium]|nr:MBL fold metallo-hydrolase [Bacillota bacterium]